MHEITKLILSDFLGLFINKPLEILGEVPSQLGSQGYFVTFWL